MNDLVALSLPLGFRDPVLDAQCVFRALLTAIASPGEIVALPCRPAPVTGLKAAASAIALTLCDMDTGVWLASECATPEAEEFLTFHTGGRLSGPAEADFVFVGHHVVKKTLGQLRQGSHLYPDRSATLIVGVERLGQVGPIFLRGPGISGVRELGVDPFHADLFNWLEQNDRRFPLGVDVVLATDDDLVAIPRSTHVEVRHVRRRQGW